MAEYHFRRSLLINPRSSVLRCYVGLALHKINRLQDALEQLQTAIDADPKNPLAKFEKAAVLISLEQFHPALQELEALKVRHLSSAHHQPPLRPGSNHPHS